MARQVNVQVLFRLAAVALTFAAIPLTYYFIQRGLHRIPSQEEWALEIRNHGPLHYSFVGWMVPLGLLFAGLVGLLAFPVGMARWVRERRPLALLAGLGLSLAAGLLLWLYDFAVIWSFD